MSFAQLESARHPDQFLLCSFSSLVEKMTDLGMGLLWSLQVFGDMGCFSKLKTPKDAVSMDVLNIDVSTTSRDPDTPGWRFLRSNPSSRCVSSKKKQTCIVLEGVEEFV